MINSEILNQIEEHTEKGNYKEAIDLIIKVYNKHPEENRLLLMAALRAIDLGDWDLFINLAEDYIGIDDKTKQLSDKKTLSIIHHHLGVGYALKKDYKKAIQYFQNALELRTKDYTICYLAQCYENIGESEKAIAFWKTAAKMGNGESIMALNTRGISF